MITKADFACLEGVDLSGKTTTIRRILSTQSPYTTIVREPLVSKEILASAHIPCEEKVKMLYESRLFLASLPNLLTERCFLSTLVYQQCVNTLSPSKRVISKVTPLLPSLIVVLLPPLEILLQRLKRRTFPDAFDRRLTTYWHRYNTVLSTYTPILTRLGVSVEIVTSAEDAVEALLSLKSLK